MSKNYYKIAVLIVFIISMLQLSFAQVPVGTIIKKTSFETGKYDSTGLPKEILDWSGNPGFSDWNENGAKVLIDSLNAHTGKYCVKITHPSDTMDIDCSADLMMEKLERTATYTVTVWIKTALTVGDAQLITEWDNNRLLTDIKGTTEWTKYEFEFEGPSKSKAALRLHVNHGKGTVWFDDLEVVKKADPKPNTLVNPGLENPDPTDPTRPDSWWVTNWGSGSQEINTDSARYFWDNTEKHSGNYSAKIKISKKDVARGTIDAGWGTRSYHFTAGGVYEFSYWAKTKNFASNSIFRISIGYNNVNLKTIRTNTNGWIQVKDTIVFPTDQENNSYRNEMRFRLGGKAHKDTLAEAWFDDVEFKLLGVLAPTIDTLGIVDNGSGKVSLAWKPVAEVANPVYHILMQPVGNKGIYEGNLLDNPGFEKPSADGSKPDGWSLYVDTWASAQKAIGEFPASETYDGSFSVYLTEQDKNDPKGIYARWWREYDKSKLQMHNAYMYGAMVNYKNVVTSNGKVKLTNSPLDSVYTCGVNILYDRYVFYFQNDNLAKLGYQTPVGTSKGWTEIGLPLTYDQAAGRHLIGIGLGQYSDGVAKGELFIDNAFVAPFKELTTTTSTSISLTDVPEGVKYFAVYVEDGSGQKYKSFSFLGVKKVATDIQNTSEVPGKFELKQNYPNPFNPATTIEYTIPKAGNVSLEIIDVLGRRIAQLVSNQFQQAGSYKVNFNASKLSSGVYFYRIITPANVMTKKMMLIK